MAAQSGDLDGSCVRLAALASSAAVEHFTQDVGMTGVAGRLLQEVSQDPSQVDRLAHIK